MTWQSTRSTRSHATAHAARLTHASWPHAVSSTKLRYAPPPSTQAWQSSALLPKFDAKWTSAAHIPAGLWYEHFRLYAWTLPGNNCGSVGVKTVALPGFGARGTEKIVQGWHTQNEIRAIDSDKDICRMHSAVLPGITSDQIKSNKIWISRAHLQRR